MALITFTPNTVIKSADVNANFSGLANWSLLSAVSAVLNNFIVGNTGVIAISSGLIGTFSNIQYFIAGQYYTITSIVNKTYTASKDTYVDVTNASGVTYTEVANNAASPALVANTIRAGVVVTSGAAITLVNQGSPTTTGPTVSSVILSVTDTLGNLIYPTTPIGGVLGYRQITGNLTTASASAVQVTGLSMPIIPTNGRRVKVQAYAFDMSSSAGGALVHLSAWDGTVGSGTQLNDYVVTSDPANTGYGGGPKALVIPSASKTYNAGWFTNGGTATLFAAATTPAFIMAEYD